MLRSIHILLALALLAPAAAFAQQEEEEAPPPDAGTEGGAASDQAPEESGPALELEGLDTSSGLQPSLPGPARRAEVENFEYRLDPGTTLGERAAAILDRTTIGGYGEHDFVVPEEGVSTFRNHRYVVFIYSQISERISTATEVEFEWAGSPLKRDGVLTFGEVLLEFSVVDLEIAEWLVFRAGVILVPVGSYNLRHDAPAQELPDRPIAYTTIVPSTWFESGVGFLGEFDLGAGMKLNYELYAINGLDARITDGLGFRGARGSNLEDNNDDKAIVGRVAFLPLLNLELGLSGYTGAYDQLNNRVNMVNGDVFWRVGPLDLHGEVVYAAVDEGFVQGFPDGSPANTRDRVPEGMFGYYAQADYRFRIEPFFRALPDEWTEGHFTASLRYEEKDTDTDFVTAEGDAARLTLGLNFRPLPPYVIKNAFYFQENGAGGDQPHLWDGDFFGDSSWTYIGSVAYLF
ncbi:hypothetical protein [Vulgatibacter sp.]|uniref:hypothetical protein n=1 Tax=Vulgatibacter sp. TaxID=1971226 RepID=UPI003561D153